MRRWHPKQTTENAESSSGMLLAHCTILVDWLVGCHVQRDSATYWFSVLHNETQHLQDVGYHDVR